MSWITLLCMQIQLLLLRLLNLILLLPVIILAPLVAVVARLKFLTPFSFSFASHCCFGQSSVPPLHDDLSNWGGTTTITYDDSTERNKCGATFLPTQHPRTAANLGGVFSLCMGISVISLIEIVYFLGIRVRYHYVQDQKNRVAQMSTATTNVVQVLQLAREATTTTKAKTKSTSDGGGGAAAWDESGWQREQQQHRVVMMTRPTAGGKRF